MLVIEFVPNVVLTQMARSVLASFSPDPTTYSETTNSEFSRILAKRPKIWQIHKQDLYIFRFLVLKLVVASGELLQFSDGF